MVVPEKDSVQKWADKNGVEGDMDSWCTNEVLYDALNFGGKSFVAICLFSGKYPPPAHLNWRETPLSGQSFWAVNVGGILCSRREIFSIGALFLAGSDR